MKMKLTEEVPDAPLTKTAPRKYEYVYSNILRHTVLHLFAVYGLYLLCTEAKWKTAVLTWFLVYAGGVGITVGAHRLWTHKTFKARMPLQIILMILNSLAFQSTAYDWIRDHRVHHKYSDTDADPYNASRGFFFSHIGWLMVRKHPEVIRRGKTIDMSDIANNPVLRFQQKYAIPVIGMCCYFIPTMIPMYFWNETFKIAFFANILRHIISLHLTYSVNSVAHLWGYKPYDAAINPVQSLLVSFTSLGEGYHNYHHVFPYDYRTAELGNNWLNFSTLIIDSLAIIGLAYDLKKATDDAVLARMIRTGDGTNLWGMAQKINYPED